MTDLYTNPARGQAIRALLFLSALLAACALLAGCAGYQFPGGSATGTGTVTGQVLAAPCTPVEQAGAPCERPVANGDVTFTSEATHVVVVTRTDSSGDYSLQLAAGTWHVSFKGLMRVISGPNPVKVEAGKTVVANYLVDSGIRVPAPA